MKKITILFATFLLTQNVFGQQKIGNNPTTINANAILELESTDKGLLIPRLALTGTNNAAPLSAFVAGMMVYNTATTGDVTPGFYVSTGSSWSKIDNQTATTLYNGNGSLSGSRTVAQGTNTLAFTSSATSGSNHFSVDGSTFSVDANNNRVGIGISSPVYPFHVLSTIEAAAKFDISTVATSVSNSSNILLINTNNTTNNYTGIVSRNSAFGFTSSIEFLNLNHNVSASALGAIRFVTNNSGNIAERMRLSSAGNLGIAKDNPSERLDVNGNVRFSGALMPNNSHGTSGQVLTSAGAFAPPTWTTLPTATTYSGSTSVILNGTSFERAALTGDVTASANNNSTTIANNVVTDAKLRQSAGVSVVGRSANSTGNVADISASADNRVLKRSAGALSFAQINDADVADVSWSKVTSRPTTLAGYGITDAAAASGNANYIQNQTGSAQSASYRISGTGTLGAITMTNTSGNVLNFENATNFTGKNTSGTVEFFLTPRGGDNVTYLNFGSAGFNIRNNAGTSRMFLQDGGNVGIGTGSPGATLNVIHPTANTTPTKPTGNWAAIIENNQDAADARNGLSVVTRWGSSDSKIFEVASYWNGSTQAYTPAFTVNGNRLVGIGTASPSERLEVVGNVRFSGALMPNNTAGTSGQVLTSSGAGAAPTWTTLSTATTLYNGNGSLSGNRTVSQGSNTLAFTGTATNAFSVDGTTFSVDAANNRIGLRTTTPEEIMHFAVSTATNVIKAGPFGNANGALFIGAGGTSGVSNWIDFNNSSGIKSGNLYLDNTIGFGINNTGTNTTIGAEGTKTGICTVTPKSTLDVNGGVAVRGINIVTEQGVHIQWNRSGSEGESWLLNQKGNGSTNSGIRFGSVTTSNTVTEWARFMDNGRFGIAQPNPQAQLHVGGGTIVDGMMSVYGSSSINIQGLHFAWNRSNGGGESWIINQRGGGGGSIRFGTSDQSNNVTELARIENNGNFGIGRDNPTHPLHMGSGAHVTSAGNWTNASDMRLKTNIINSKYGLKDVLQLRSVDYNMKSNGEKQVGFIAQEVKKVIPEVVSGDENSETMMGISYGNLVPVLVNAIKEQQAQIEKMQKEIEELKKEKK